MGWHQLGANLALQEGLQNSACMPQATNPLASSPLSCSQQDVTFHPCVNLGRFNAEKVRKHKGAALSAWPPDLAGRQTAGLAGPLACSALGLVLALPAPRACLAAVG